MATRTRPTSFQASQKAIANTGIVLEAAVSMARGISGVEDQYSDMVLQSAQSEFPIGIGLQQLLIRAALRAGLPIPPGMRVTSGNIKEVLRAGFSTASLPGILSNIANKELLQGYNEEDQTWKEVSVVKPVTDLKPHTSYRMLDDMEYEELGPGGKIKHGTVDEESYTRQAGTYAKMATLTRTHIINDDIGALDDIRFRVGRGGAKKFNRVFWTEWLSSVDNLFTALNGNYITGAATTLLNDMVGLSIALDAFDSLRTPTADGGKVPSNYGGSPAILLTPGGGISRVAETIFANENMGGVDNGDANIHAGKYKPVKSVFLNDASVPGGSALAWYLLRSPTDAAGAVVSFLNGMTEPTVESAEANFDTLGIQFRGYHDFGVDPAEYLCGIKSKGAV